MLYNLFITIINKAILLIGTLLKLVISVLPPSPFDFTTEKIPYLSSLNWVMPFNVFVTMLSAGVVAYFSYLLVSALARYIKLIK